LAFTTGESTSATACLMLSEIGLQYRWYHFHFIAASSGSTSLWNNLFLETIALPLLNYLKLFKTESEKFDLTEILHDWHTEITGTRTIGTEVPGSIDIGVS